MNFPKISVCCPEMHIRSNINSMNTYILKSLAQIAPSPKQVVIDTGSYLSKEKFQKAINPFSLIMARKNMDSNLLGFTFRSQIDKG